jgi:NADP-reducing hydrogenase subunit HndB
MLLEELIMKSLEELNAIRDKKKDELSQRKDSKNLRIVVGMASCGIAAGAKPVMDEIISELKTRNISGVRVSMTGCMGICRLEPIVEVINPDETRVTYANIDAEKAKRIVAEHIVNGRICTDLTIDAVQNNDGGK